ncbi:hypothetical protein ACIQ9P_12665 [Kitasatospora sp. NPDC094019]|uniref:hypothetical protein n=1 Tax=Kitasatospora sp. NPDC094019 TaxID=3364091 RepID=UPI00381E2DBC
MSGDHFHGDVVNLYGGTDNKGIVHHHHAPGPDGERVTAELTRAVQDLVTLLRELRAGVAPMAAESIDEALPALTVGPLAVPRERHRALMAVAGIAATVGAVGVPVVEAVQRVLGLLGGQ